MIGKTLGKYRIVEHLGRGGMAEVYKAYQPGLDRYVAIKLMHTFLVEEEGFLGRFQREAKAVARLRHPNIVQVYDFDVEDGVYYMVMEFIDGITLKAKLQELEAQGQRLPLEEAVRIVKAVGEALAYAHKQGMVHRDVKPANIMLTREGHVILTDFGIAKILGSSTQFTASGMMIGTPAYMAPEQGMGAHGDERSDIYSLGVVLYQLVTGRLPFDADTPLAIVLKHLNDPLPLPRAVNPELSEGIERVILKALAKDPADRYQSVEEMLADLDKAMQGIPLPAVDPAITTASAPAVEPVTAVSGRAATVVSREAAEQPPTTAAPPTVVTEAPPRAARLRRWIALGGVAALLLIGGILFLLSIQRRGPGIPAIVSQATATATATPVVTPSPSSTSTPDLPATRLAELVAALSATPTPSPTPTNTPTPSPTPTSTPTPDLTATAIAACVPSAEFVKHVTYPEGVYLAPGTAFEKTWRFRNDGECPWRQGTRLVFVEGEQMGGPDEVEAGPLEIGETIDLSVKLTAPSANGRYEGVWQLRDAQDRPLGDPVRVVVNVGPTPTPRPTPTPTASPTPLGPLNMTVPTLLPGSCWVDPNTGTWGGTLVWQAFGGTGEYRYYHGDIKPELELSGPRYEFTGQVNRRFGPESFFTVSGNEVVKQDVIIEYPPQC